MLTDAERSSAECDIDRPLFANFLRPVRIIAGKFFF
ncbi:hypothetical protein EM595_0210 [Duffyella gerundensis]|uniref:Uncharacterized protein n=1 Tax=Duffyella gerundensis TaxID=1619313 RepID=A0A0U5KYC7_9GAMM|nr:hypothetical protein EM595_0210 [Duffyella gerundensis]